MSIKINNTTKIVLDSSFTAKTTKVKIQPKCQGRQTSKSLRPIVIHSEAQQVKLSSSLSATDACIKVSDIKPVENLISDETVLKTDLEDMVLYEIY